MIVCFLHAHIFHALLICDGVTNARTQITPRMQRMQMMKMVQMMQRTQWMRRVQSIKEMMFCNRQALCSRNKESLLQDKASLLPGVDSPRFSSTEKDSLLHAKASRPPKKASLIKNHVDYEILCINVWDQLVLCVADE